MTRELDTDAAVRERAVDLLRALDLLRPARPRPDAGPTPPTRWWVSPAAARFRNPTVTWQTGLLDEPETGGGRE